MQIATVGNQETGSEAAHYIIGYLIGLFGVPAIHAELLCYYASLYVSSFQAFFASTMTSPHFLEALNTRRTAVKLTGLPLIILSFQTLGQMNPWTIQTFY